MYTHEHWQSMCFVLRVFFLALFFFRAPSAFHFTSEVCCWKNIYFFLFFSCDGILFFHLILFFCTSQHWHTWKHVEKSYWQGEIAEEEKEAKQQRGKIYGTIQCSKHHKISKDRLFFIDEMSERHVRRIIHNMMQWCLRYIAIDTANLFRVDDLQSFFFAEMLFGIFERKKGGKKIRKL